LRGGGWSYNYGNYSRAAYRYSYFPDSADYYLGFRLSR
jgi:formylglycine-generating enzyme required for sulfatase activity